MFRECMIYLFIRFAIRWRNVQKKNGSKYPFATWWVCHWLLGHDPAACISLLARTLSRNVAPKGYTCCCTYETWSEMDASKTNKTAIESTISWQQSHPHVLYLSFGRARLTYSYLVGSRRDEYAELWWNLIVFDMRYYILPRHSTVDK